MLPHCFKISHRDHHDSTRKNLKRCHRNIGASQVCRLHDSDTADTIKTVRCFHCCKILQDHAHHANDRMHSMNSGRCHQEVWKKSLHGSPTDDEGINSKNISIFRGTCHYNQPLHANNHNADGKKTMPCGSSHSCLSLYDNNLDDEVYRRLNSKNTNKGQNGYSTGSLLIHKCHKPRPSKSWQCFHIEIADDKKKCSRDSGKTFKDVFSDGNDSVQQFMIEAPVKNCPIS